MPLIQLKVDNGPESSGARTFPVAVHSRHHFIRETGPALKHKRPGQGPPSMLVGFGVAAPIPADELVGVDFKLAI
jgi:hypothetical protein